MSAHGPIFKEASLLFRQRCMPRLIYLRMVIAMLELIALLVSIIDLYHPSAVSMVEECEPLGARLTFARAVVLFQVVCYVLFWCTVCIYVDPLGCCTPGVLNGLGDDDGRIWDQFDTISVDESSAVMEDHVWRRKNRLLVNDDHIDTVQKHERRLHALNCCLRVKCARLRGVVAEDVGRGLYPVFGVMDYVLSDVIAGFTLLKEDQLKTKKGRGEIALTERFRKVYMYAYVGRELI